MMRKRRLIEIVAVLVAGLGDGGRAGAQVAAAPPFHLDDANLPSPSRTPGDVAKEAKVRDLCSDDSAARRAMPSPALCEGMFATYRIPLHYRYQYACRFLVPLGIGGADTPKNVWPQPVHEVPAKDALDAAVRKRVCDDDVPLAQVQGEIAVDWVTAYRRYLLPGDPPPHVYATDAPAAGSPDAGGPQVIPGLPAPGQGGGLGSSPAGGLDPGQFGGADRGQRRRRGTDDDVGAGGDAGPSGGEAPRRRGTDARQGAGAAGAPSQAPVAQPRAVPRRATSAAGQGQRRARVSSSRR